MMPIKKFCLFFALLFAAALSPAQGDGAISTGWVSGKPDNRRQKPLPPSSQALAASHSAQSKYVVLELAVRENDGAAPAENFYVDVFKAHLDGRRELVRTQRQAGSSCQLYIERGFGHYLKIEIWEHEPLELKVGPNETEAGAAFLKKEAILKKLALPETPVIVPAPAPVLAMQAGPLASNSAPTETPATVVAVSSSPPSPDRRTELLSPAQKHFRLAADASLYHAIGDTSKAIARLNAGTQVEVLERTTSAWWLAICQGKVGWLETSSLE